MKDIENKLRISQIMQIVWATLTFSIILYAILPIIAPDLLKNKSNFLPENILYGIAGSLAGGSFLIRKLMHDENRFGTSLKKTQIDIQKTDIKVFSTAIISYVISWVLNEAIALLGFVNIIATGDLKKSLPLIGFAFFMQILAFPKSHHFKEMLSRIKADSK